MAEREQTQRPSLSFSIDNILRDDFPGSSRHNRTVPYFVHTRSFPHLRPPQVGFPCHECLTSRYRPAPVYLYNPQDMKKEAEFLSRTPGKMYPEAVRSSVRCEVGKSSNEEQGAGVNKSSYCKEKIPNDERNKQEKDDDQSTSSAKNDQQKEKKKRFRSHFSQLQLQYLENIFARQHYLSRDERTLLANALDMTELQVRNWFQNKRYQKRHREIQALQKVGKQVPVQVLVNEGSPLINTIRHELRY